jgi:hypothetical protein
MSDKVSTKAEREAESVADELLQDRIIEAIGDAVQAATRDHKRAGSAAAVTSSDGAIPGRMVRRVTGAVQVLSAGATGALVASGMGSQLIAYLLRPR